MTHPTRSHPASCLIFSLCLFTPLALVAEDLPVTKVALFSSGVGYFEHRGSISGDVTVSLPFSTAEVDDALKSLVIRDPGAGGPGGVRPDDAAGRLPAGGQVRPGGRGPGPLGRCGVGLR